MTPLSPHYFISLILKRLLTAAMLLITIIPSPAGAAEAAASRLLRVAVRPHPAYTRISFFLDTSPDYNLSILSGGKISVTLRKTGGPLFKRLRSYSDSFVDGIRITPRGGSLRVLIAPKGEPGVRQLTMSDTNVLTIDIGPQFSTTRESRVLPEREPIRNGAGKLIKDFDPPFKSIFPFMPSDRRELIKLISERDTAMFMLGESALYKGKAAQAEELFTVFSQRESPVRPLATYRLGESLYILQKYSAALKAFREAEKLWPEYMTINPATAFYYADSIVRSGDFAGGRKSLSRLIDRLADRKYAPLLLVRLADILARQQHDMEAQAIYRSVAANFAGSKAGSYAKIKLADRRIFTVTGDNYHELLDEYQDLFDHGSDPSLREEALFKAALLESLYGPAPAALQMVMKYEKKYPGGLFITIARGMREELLPIICRDMYAAKDFAGFVSLVQDNENYLSRCFADIKFAERLDEAFTSLGALQKEITLFGRLLDREWAAASVPFMLSRIIDDALSLADFTLAENTARGFLQKFPNHAEIWAIREKLGKICFLKNDMATVRAELGWMLEGKKPVEAPESWYYLGKALAGQQNHKNADRALSAFIALVKDTPSKSPLLPDAYYTCAAERATGGDRAGGMNLYRSGLEIAGRELRDQFLYKMGELSLQQGERETAKGYWERIMKEGTDPLWKKMAGQSLADLAWREQYRDMSK